jgi:hypothetical protein
LLNKVRRPLELESPILLPKLRELREFDVADVLNS